jgi:hypothetical protein
LPGRPYAPRHKSSRSLSRSLGRLASGVAGAVPTPGITSAAAVVGVTGVALGIGVLSTGDESAAQEPAAGASAPVNAEDVADLLAGRKAENAEVSRSLARPATVSQQRDTKTAHLPVTKQDMAGQVTKTVKATDPQDIAILMMADYGWGMDEFSCLDDLYVSESDWDHTATNPSSGAYGIPQALPAEKMASAGSDWRTNPATQIEWGLDYIRSSYGTPCSAWSFKAANNWY